MLLWPVTEAVSFCSPHSHLHRLVSEGSGNLDGSPRCSSKALPGQDRHLSSGREGARMTGAGNGVCLRSCPLGTLGGFHRLCAQVTWCCRQPEGICDPGQARFSASLMLSQVPRDWIGTEVMFHSPVVLRLCGESSRGPWGCPQTPCQNAKKLAIINVNLRCFPVFIDSLITLTECPRETALGENFHDCQSFMAGGQNRHIMTSEKRITQREKLYQARYNSQGVRS